MCENISYILLEQSLKYPNKIAIIYNDKQIKYKDLENYVAKCTTLFYQKGIRENDNIIHLFENELLLSIALFASARMGVTLIPASKNTSESFFNEMKKEFNISFIISDLKNTNINDLITVYLENDMLNKLEINTNIYVSNPKNPWYIIIGSGSTGKRKLIPEYHKQLIAQTKLIGNNLPIQNNDKIASFIPLNYASTQARLLESIYIGATFILLPKFNNSIIELLKSLNITILYATVFHIEKLLNFLPNNSIQILDFLKMLSIGSSTISATLREQIQSKLTKNLYIRYSTNEIGPIAIASKDETLLIPESVGKTIKGITVQIVNNNNVVQDLNTVGHIRIKSPGMAPFYINDKEATKKSFKDGWFYPRDMGKLTSDNQLIFLGRSDNMMIMNGINIYPTQIENAILKHSDVIEAIAFPLKNKISQDIPVCAVVLRKNSQTTEVNLIKYLNEKIASYSPKFIIILDKPIRNSQGKIRKKDLNTIVNNYLNLKLI